MPPERSLASTSLILSVATAVLAVLLGLGQWWEHRTRGISLSQADQRHFFWQDLRRAAGILLMGMLALGIYVGSRIPPMLSDFPLDPGFKDAMRAVAGSWVSLWINGQANPQFLTLWLLVFMALVTLLVLALVDWRATRHYAHRQRQALAGERLEILRETLRQRDAGHNGFPPDPGTDGT